jgi:DNA-binding Xre family transcriptional regulator
VPAKCLHEYLEELRVKSGFETKKAFATNAGVWDFTYTNFIHNHSHDITVSTLLRLCAALDLHLVLVPGDSVVPAELRNGVLQRCPYARPGKNSKRKSNDRNTE